MFMAISAPGVTKPGSETTQPTSLLDLFPTLLELSRLPRRPELEGVSLVPLLRDPDFRLERSAVVTSHYGVNFAVRSHR